MSMNTTSSYTPKIVGAITLTAIMLIGVYVFLISPQEKTTIDTSIIQNVPSQTIGAASASTNPAPATEATKVMPEPPSTPSTPVPKPTTTYKDGIYTQSISYSVPGETNTLNLSVTVKSDTVTAITASSTYTDRESQRYVSGFESNISGQVVGTKLKDIKVSRVGGASLTTGAFTRALPAIEATATL
jgi:uncharacterized protein with FMN-binding domain